MSEENKVQIASTKNVRIKCKLHSPSSNISYLAWTSGVDFKKEMLWGQSTREHQI